MLAVQVSLLVESSPPTDPFAALVTLLLPALLFLASALYLAGSVLTSGVGGPTPDERD